MSYKLLTNAIIDRIAPTIQPSANPPLTNIGSMFDCATIIATINKTTVIPINPSLSYAIIRLFSYYPIKRITKRR